MSNVKRAPGLFYCGRCRQSMEREHFYEVPSSSTGVSCRCKPCERALQAERRRAAGQKEREPSPDSATTGLRWRARNRAHLRSYFHNWRLSLKKRPPCPWADPGAIQKLYDEAALLTEISGEVHEVDHRIPLRGKRVSGLHVHTNLRVLTALDNRRKSNRFEEAT